MRPQSAPVLATVWVVLNPPEDTGPELATIYLATQQLDTQVYITIVNVSMTCHLEVIYTS